MDPEDTPCLVIADSGAQVVQHESEEEAVMLLFDASQSVDVSLDVREEMG